MVLSIKAPQIKINKICESVAESYQALQQCLYTVYFQTFHKIFIAGYNMHYLT